jgi:hypothetical protein
MVEEKNATVAGPYTMRISHLKYLLSVPSAAAINYQKRRKTRSNAIMNITKPARNGNSI